VKESSDDNLVVKKDKEEEWGESRRKRWKM
jgi:hypothetical protein